MIRGRGCRQLFTVGKYKKKHLTDQGALEIMKKPCKISSVDDWQKVDRNTRDNYMGRLKQEGLSVRQISRLTGLNRGIVLKALVQLNNPIPQTLPRHLNISAAEIVLI